MKSTPWFKRSLLSRLMLHALPDALRNPLLRRLHHPLVDPGGWVPEAAAALGLEAPEALRAARWALNTNVAWMQLLSEKHPARRARFIRRYLVPPDAEVWEQRAAQAGSGGLILLGTHLGPREVLLDTLKASPLDPWPVTWDLRHLPAAELRDFKAGRITRKEQVQRNYFSALDVLRDGGAAYLAGDAQLGGKLVPMRFAGLSVHGSLGPARLARHAGAVAIPCASLWKKGRIHIHFGSPLPSPQSAAEERDWLQAYLDQVARWCRSNPQNLRGTGGMNKYLWEATRELVQARAAVAL